MATLLRVKDLRTHFFTEEGVVRAVNGVSYDLEEGETLGLVGESGCGKSVSALSLLRLIPNPPGKIVGGEVWFDGQDILKADEDEIRHIRGNRIAMVFQEPMTSLNPVLTIGRQITEALELHLKMDKHASSKRATELLEMVGIPEAGGPSQRLPASVLRRHAPARHDRHGAVLQSQAAPRGRAHDGAGRHDPGPDPGDHGPPEQGAGHGGHHHHAQSRRRRALRGSRQRDVRRPDRRDGAAKELYANPRHPYTLGLLRSVPRLGRDRERISWSRSKVYRPTW